MESDDLSRRKQSLETDALIITKTDSGFRVYSPIARDRSYLVRSSAEGLTCTCPDFAEHEQGGICKHIRAVEGRFGGRVAQQDSEAFAERRAIQEESATSAASQMIIKRSVSPDGRIDALSVEFSCPVAERSPEEIESRAVTVLQVQDAIARRFLRRNEEEIRAPATASTPRAETGVPAQMVDIGGMDGKWGRRLFLRFQANGRMLRLFGNRKQLAQWIGKTGLADFAEDIREGVRLHLPCRVVTTPSEDGRFLNITEVLPIQGEGGS